MCIDILEIWFGIANGQISSFLTELSARDMVVVGYYRFRSFSKYLCPPTSGELDILFLVWIPLALASVSHFLFCTIFCELVVGFLPNLHGYGI